MPEINHPNIGEVVDTHYYFGIMKEVYSGDELGLCRVEVTVPGQGVETLDMVPIYYHCDPDKEERDNGSLEDGETAFAVDDEVIVQVIGDIKDVNS